MQWRKTGRAAALTFLPTDPFAPEFQTCPLDFVEPQPGPVTWAVPVARDNVGLAVPPTSSYHPGAVLQAGSHMIEYWAEDFEGNIARCSFVITVGQSQYYLLFGSLSHRPVIYLIEG